MNPILLVVFILLPPIAGVILYYEVGYWLRTEGENAALDVAADPEIADEDALRQIADACTHSGTAKHIRIASSGDQYWVFVHYETVEGSAGVGIELIDRRAKAHLGRMASCMFLAGKSRGLVKVDLDQRLRTSTPTYRASLEVQELATVPRWDWPHPFDSFEFYMKVFRRMKARRRGILAH